MIHGNCEFFNGGESDYTKAADDISGDLIGILNELLEKIKAGIATIPKRRVIESK